ncbi:tryptophan 2,3-dioxygenase family protein [Streptomyces sp. NPDC058548]|uniref:tryptophan 2,3-dioxygenase family protein n=1 Tax=unclassified Streptomyces TaxID=2593676 RepID=UPI003660F30A
MESDASVRSAEHHASPPSVTYTGYLRLPELLQLQTPLTADDRPHTQLSEHLFIVVHQSCELWLRHILLELRATLDALGRHPSHLHASVGHLRNAASCAAQLSAQTRVLEELPLAAFHDFRSRLGTASGAQSGQFHELYRIVGLDDPPGPLMAAVRRVMSYYGTTPARARLERAPGDVLYEVADALDRLAAGIRTWQEAHIHVVTRALGDDSGTGGTSGAQYLRSRARAPFPELRADLTAVDRLEEAV